MTRDGGIRKRSLTIAGHRTSVSLEEPFWDGLSALAQARGTSVPALVGEIDSARGAGNLSSAIRVFVLRELTRDREDRPSSSHLPSGGRALKA